ncbi:MAG: glycosyltransferase family 39 protein [Magnetococcales bacterium]|nr:glycosyltransferase family 39 protein [Magnetococcales bacterium]
MTQVTINRSSAGFGRADQLFIVLLCLTVFWQAALLHALLQHYPAYGWTTEHTYGPIAKNLLQYGVYSLGDPPNLQPFNWRPPLYAMTLTLIYGLFGMNDLYALVWNNLLFTATVLLIFLLGRRLHPWVGLLAALLFVLDPMGVVASNAIQADIQFTFLMALLLLHTDWIYRQGITMPRLAVNSLILAAVVYTRAAAMYLWIVLLLALAVHLWRQVSFKRFIQLALLFATIQAIAMGGWMTRNYLVTDRFEFAGMKYIHLFSFHLPLVISRRDGITFQDAKQQLIRQITNDNPAYQQLPTEVARQDYLLHYAITEIKNNWPYSLLVILDNVPRLFLGYPGEVLTPFYTPDKLAQYNDFVEHGYPSGTNASLSHDRWHYLRYLIEQGFWPIAAYGIVTKGLGVVLFGLACFGVVVLVRCRHDQTDRSLGWLLFFFCGTMIAVSCVAIQGRFRVPILPAMDVLAAYAVIYLVDRKLLKVAV